ncbi:MAG: hypothetical protein ABI045_06960 [Flavobacteriales bacterium]
MQLEKLSLLIISRGKITLEKFLTVQSSYKVYLIERPYEIDDLKSVDLVIVAVNDRFLGR